MKKFFTMVFSIIYVVAMCQVQVTFQVDMTGQTISPNGVHIAGSLNGWDTSANTLLDQGNSIYALTLDLQPGVDYEYKYLNGNEWGTEEAAPSTCTVGGNNRTFTAPTEDATFDVTPFNSCPAAVATQTVIFRVDMTGQTVSGNGVHVAGNFQAWNPAGTQMTEVGNNIYEVSVSVLSSLRVLQYKFVNGNAWGAEETPGDGCGNSSNNRPYIIQGAGSTVLLPTAIFGGCATPIPTKTVVFTANLGGASVADQGMHVAGSFQGWNPSGTPMTEIADDTYQVAVEVLNTTSYIEYKYLNGSEWGSDEVVPGFCSYNNNRFQIIELTEGGPINLENFEFGTCNGISVATDELDETVTFSVTPTIATNYILIKLSPEYTGSGILSALLVSGELVHQEQITKLSAERGVNIDVSEWPVGMYVLQLHAAGKVHSQKIVVR